MHFKAHVIKDLYKLFDTHSIAGIKLSQKLIGPAFQLFPDKITEPEPTANADSDEPEGKKKKKRKIKRKKKFFIQPS